MLEVLAVFTLVVLAFFLEALIVRHLKKENEALQRECDQQRRAADTYFGNAMRFERERDDWKRKFEELAPEDIREMVLAAKAQRKKENDQYKRDIEIWERLHEGLKEWVDKQRELERIREARQP